MTGAKRHARHGIVVTGGASGIGQAIVEKLLAEGARVVVLDRDEPSYEAFTQAQGTGRAVWFAVDLANADAVRRVAEQSVAHLGNVYGLVHAAAHQAVIPFGEVTVEDWNRTLAVNVSSAFILVQSLAPAMLLSRRGRVVFISSSSLYAPPPNLVHYVSSKGALVGLTRSLSHELGPDGITVNAVAPGLTRTANAIANIPAGHFDVVMAGQGVKRSGEASDHAGIVSFLLSDDASFITGQTILVDGGESHL